MIIQDLKSYFEEQRKKRVRMEYARLINPKSKQDDVDSYHCVVDIAFKLLSVFKHKKYPSEREQEANLLYQFTISKCLAVLQLMKGVTFKGAMNLENLVDPFHMVPLIRSQFESFGAYNHIFIQGKSDEESLFRYKLWVLSGLNYRQRFASHATFPESIKKLHKERNLIEELTNTIFNMEYVKQLTPTEISKLKKHIKRKEWKIEIKNDSVFRLGWFDLVKNAGTGTKFEILYDDFSLNAHPSNVAIFRYRDMFGTGDNLKLAYTHLSFSRCIIALMIYDQMIFFPELKLIFNALNPVHQLLLNGLNEIFRGPGNKLNNIEQDFM